jgi:hypothetical protein
MPWRRMGGVGCRSTYWPVSRPCHVNPGQRAPGTHWVGGPRDGLDDMEKWQFEPLGSRDRSRLSYRSSWMNYELIMNRKNRALRSLRSSRCDVGPEEGASGAVSLSELRDSAHKCRRNRSCLWRRWIMRNGSGLQASICSRKRIQYWSSSVLLCASRRRCVPQEERKSGASRERPTAASSRIFDSIFMTYTRLTFSGMWGSCWFWLRSP